MIKSTYNFIPAPSKNEVYKPEWADQVSHDVPFSDGESGEIELTLTAKTPVFIRNGHSKKDAEQQNDQYLSFSNIQKNGKKEFFIPATSLKGMFRNVFEIITRSRMNQVNDDRYSLRDLSSSQGLYLTKYKEFEIKAGWLIQDTEGKWKVEECEEFAFIHHKELSKKGFRFRELFLDKQPKDKSGKYKYDISKSIERNWCFETYTKELFGNVKRTMANFSEGEQSKKGTLVFTGQSSKRHETLGRDGKPKMSGKVHEFVFMNSAKPNFINVNDRKQKDFKFIYLDDKVNISPDWKYWRNKLENGEKVPVFYAKNGEEIEHFGLTYMYKLPYEKSVKQLQPIVDYNSKEIDFSQTVFGTTVDNLELKGRVYFSNAFTENAKELPVTSEILGGPKASYVPFYLKQPETVRNANSYKTYMEESELRGFKKYPIHEYIKSGSYDDKQKANKKVFSFFKPLNENAIFKSKIRFHNLRKVEIGALLSAITFHGNHEKSFHSLGGLKPFGYGKMAVSDINLSKNLNFDENAYMSEFEDLIGGEEWISSSYMTELLTIAQISDSSLRYPENPKTFVEYKKDKLKLEAYSKIVDKEIKVQSISKKVEFESKMDDFEFTNIKLDDLKNQIKELGYVELPLVLHEKLKEAIIQIMNNHKASKRKLQKPFEKEYYWHTTISTWVGYDKSKKWSNELNNKI